MTFLDVLTILAYGVVVLWIGLRARRSDTDASEFMLARRRLPTGAVLGSMVATELSAATFIGVPHAAYTGDWRFLQFAFGAFAGKLLLSWKVIPLYHRLGVVTVYGFLAQRFGPRTRRLGAASFVVGRIFASGARLFIAGLAVATVTQISVEAAVVICGVVAGLYTWAGGIRAVVWTDVLQGAVFVVAALAVIAVLAARAPEGLSGILDWASAGNRLRIFHAPPWIALADSRPFLVGLIGGFFLTLATHATDYDMVQRLLTTRDGAAGGRALAGSALLNFPLTALFLFIGTGFAYFYAAPPAYDISDHQRILPLFALHELPSGIRGLVFAGLFAACMSSLDSAICAIATTWVVDVFPGNDTNAPDVRRVRGASVVSCGLLVVAAIGVSAYQRSLAAGDGAAQSSLVELALSAMTILYGGLLGVFGFGLLTRRRGSDMSAVVGLAAGGVIGLALFLHPLVLGRTWIAWPWWIPISGAVCAAIVACGRADQSAPDSARGSGASAAASRASGPRIKNRSACSASTAGLTRNP